jgi:hypothetical protein
MAISLAPKGLVPWRLLPVAEEACEGAPAGETHRQQIKSDGGRVLAAAVYIRVMSPPTAPKDSTPQISHRVGHEADTRMTIFRPIERSTSVNLPWQIQCPSPVS